MATIGNLLFDISANIAGLVQGVNESKRHLASLSSSATSLTGTLKNVGNVIKAAFVAAPVVAVADAIKQVADRGEELYATSKKIGIGVDKLSALKFAAEQSETSFESLTRGMGMLSRKIYESTDEINNQNRALKILGISGNDAHAILLKLADRFANMQDGVNKTGLAMLLFGRAGKEMIPFLNEGSAKILELEERAKELGIVFSPNGAKQADEFNDRLRELKERAFGFAKTIGDYVIPTMIDFFKILNPDKLDRTNQQIDFLEKSIKELSKPSGFLPESWFPGVSEDRLKRLDEYKKKLQELLSQSFTHKTTNLSQAPDFQAKAPKLPDISGQKKALQEWIDNLKTTLKMFEAELKHSEDISNIHTALTVDNWQTDTAVMKDNLEAEKSILEKHYDDALTSTKDYYEGLRNLGLKNYQAEVDLIRNLADTEKKKIQTQITDQESLYQSLIDARAKLATKVGTDVSAAKEMNVLKEQADNAKKEIEKLAATLANIDPETANKIKVVGNALYNNIVRLNMDEPTEKIKRYFETLAKLRGVNDDLVRSQQSIADMTGDYSASLEAEIVLVKSEMQAKIDSNEQRIREIEAIGVTTDALQKELNLRLKLRDALIQESNLKADRSFGAGAMAGITEYLKSLNDMFERGKQLAGETAHKIEDTLVDMFDKPKKAMDDLLDYFKKTLLRMIVEAAANPIIVQIAQGVTSLGGAAAGGIGSLAQSMGLAGGTAGSIPGSGMGAEWVINGSASAGIGSILSSSNLYSAAALAAVFMVSKVIEKIKSGNYLQATGYALGIIPGMILDALGVGESHPKFGFRVNKLGQGFATEQAGGFAGDTTELNHRMKDYFNNFRDSLKTGFEDLGIDTSGFIKQWEATFEVKGLTEEQIQKRIGKLLGQYANFVLPDNVEFNFKQFQKSGETLGDTALRVVDALIKLKNNVGLIGDVIDAINESNDDLAQYKKGIADIDENIKQLWKTFKDATDPSDQLAAAQELENAIYSRYETEKSFVEALAQKIADLKDQIQSFIITSAQKIIDLSKKIGDVGTLIPQIESFGFGLYNKYQAGGGTTDERISMLEQLTEWVDMWVDAQKEMINEQYQKVIDANSQEMDILNEQLKVLQTWKSLNDSVKATINDLLMSTSNPADIFERLGMAQSEVARINALYQGATGENKATLGQQLEDAIKNVLSIGQQAYQRPSTEYQSLFSDMLNMLNMLQSDSAGYASEAQDVQDRIASLQEANNALTIEMNAKLKAIDDQAADYYSFIREQLIGLYTTKFNEMTGEVVSLETTLDNILGPDGTVASYIDRLRTEATDELRKVRTAIEDFMVGLGLSIPQYAEGTDYVPKTGLAYIHQGEKVIPKGEGNGQFILNLSPIIYANGDASPKEIWNELEQYAIQSMKSGNLGKMAQRVTK